MIKMPEGSKSCIVFMSRPIEDLLRENDRLAEIIEPAYREIVPDWMIRVTPDRQHMVFLIMLKQSKIVSSPETFPVSHRFIEELNALAKKDILAQLN